MRARFLVLLGGIIACSSAGGVASEYREEPPPPAPLPEPEPLVDAGADATPVEVDAGPCSDCEYFPETCSTDTLCPNGPFEPGTSGGSFDPRTMITVIRGRSASDVWAAGAVGALAHFDGKSWRRLDLATQETFWGVWLLDGADVVFGHLLKVRARGIAVPDGGAPPASGWTEYEPTYAPGQIPMTYSSGPIFAGAWASPGGEWMWGSMKGSTQGGLWRLRRSESGALEGGRGIPSAACNSAFCYQVASIHGASADQLWAVGSGGVALRIDGAEAATPTLKAFNTQTWNALSGVWQASATDAWAVGAGGTIRHYAGDPSLWEVVDGVPTSADLNAVWGFSPSDVWAVGDAGVVLHYDGKTWSRVKVAGLAGRRPNLTSIWGAEPGQVWIGGQGVILSLGGEP